MFFYYTVLTFITLFSQLAMLVIFRTDNLLPKENKRYFTLAFITFTIGTFLEWFSDYILLYINFEDFRYTLIQAIMHIVIPMTPYYLGCAFKKFKDDKTFKILLYTNIFIQALSLTPFFINNFHDVFSVGNTYILYFSIFLYVLCRMFANVFQVAKSYQSGSIYVLIFNIFVITNFTVVLQSISNGINTIFIVNTANSIVLYGYYGSLINKRDGLTLLLNRRCFENKIKSLKTDKVFLFLDLNKFKEINDTHGHLAGDQILKDIAAVCLETFSPYGNTYRIGGDEYCIILKKRLDEIDKLIPVLHKNIDEKRKTNPLLPTVSVGYGKFFYNKNTVNDAISEADAMMYKIKNKHKISEYKI